MCERKSCPVLHLGERKARFYGVQVTNCALILIIPTFSHVCVRWVMVIGPELSLCKSPAVILWRVISGARKESQKANLIIDHSALQRTSAAFPLPSLASDPPRAFAAHTHLHKTVCDHAALLEFRFLKGLQGPHGMNVRGSGVNYGTQRSRARANEGPVCACTGICLTTCN